MLIKYGSTFLSCRNWPLSGSNHPHSRVHVPTEEVSETLGLRSDCDWRLLCSMFMLPHLTVQTEEDEHHEEQTGPEWGQRHHGNSFGVCNECKARTCIVEVPKTREAHIHIRLTDPDGCTWMSIITRTPTLNPSLCHMY